MDVMAQVPKKVGCLVCLMGLSKDTVVGSLVRSPVFTYIYINIIQYIYMTIYTLYTYDVQTHTHTHIYIEVGLLLYINYH